LKKEEGLMQYDYSILMFINGLSGHLSWLDMLVTSFSKYGPLIFGFYFIGLWFTGKSPEELTKNRRQALYAFTAALLALGINQVIGFICFRNRPYIDHPVHRLFPVTSDASFPSDHAAGEFSIASSIFLERSFSGAVLFILASLLAVSRIYAGIHYPSDILGGIVVGLISSMIVDSNKDVLEKPINLILSVWNQIEAKFVCSKRENPKAIMGKK
jgi:undecaprenyl-diphosphatase